MELQSCRGARALRSETPAEPPPRFTVAANSLPLISLAVCFCCLALPGMLLAAGGPHYSRGCCSWQSPAVRACRRLDCSAWQQQAARARGRRPGVAVICDSSCATRNADGRCGIPATASETCGRRAQPRSCARRTTRLKRRLLDSTCLEPIDVDIATLLYWSPSGV